MEAHGTTNLKLTILIGTTGLFVRFTWEKDKRVAGEPAKLLHQRASLIWTELSVYGHLLTLTMEDNMASAEELIALYEITKDSDSIKRVNELAVKRDEAEAKGDTSEVDIIDTELRNMGGNYAE